MLRQFSLALIAWNYPRVYARAIEAQKQTSCLEDDLERVLGFSPYELAEQLADKWNLAFDILAAVASKPNRSTTAVFSSGISKNRPIKEQLSLGRICWLSDALARINFPEHYPTTIENLDYTLEQIFEPLTSKTLTAVYFRAHLYVSEFAPLIPDGVNFGLPKELRERIAHSEKLQRLLDNNLHLRQLPDDLKQEIKLLYSRFQPNKILKANINKLIEDIIPKAGFTGGCIFVYEPDEDVLNPAIVIGGPSEDRTKPMKVRRTVDKPNLITSSFMMKSPLREEVPTASGQSSIAIAGALGNCNRVGVLYLESDTNVTFAESKEALTAYRAIRQCVTDCFNIS